MENKRKYLRKLFRFLMTLCFCVFIVLFASHKTGYSEYENRKQVQLTEKQIKKFEQDISAGKQIDIKPYLKTSKKNYQNGLSRMGLNLSKVAGSMVRIVVDKSFKFLSKLAE